MIYKPGSGGCDRDIPVSGTCVRGDVEFVLVIMSHMLSDYKRVVIRTYTQKVCKIGSKR